MSANIVVLGGSFAGLTAAYDLKRTLKHRANVTVIARQEYFVFIPSLIWVVPGWREPKQICFKLQPSLAWSGIDFVCARADRIDPDRNTVVTDKGDFAYDYLVIATGPQYDWDAVPGIGPHGGYTQSVCSLPHAMEARCAWQEFLKDPGPVVLGSTQYASCFGAEYEMVFNVDRALREAKVRDRAPVTFISPEPFLGHFGIGGMKGGQAMMEWFLRLLKIDWVINTTTEEVVPGEVHLGNGQVVPFKYAIIIPPFMGVEAIRNSPGIGDARGFVPTNARYQHPDFPNIYAAGVAVATKPPEPTPVPCGVPKTGYMSEVMAKVAAHNVAADITGGEPKELPFNQVMALCIMDAGKQGVIMLSDHVFRPRRFEILLPGPWSHWAKIAFEKYYLWKMWGGRSQLP